MDRVMWHVPDWLAGTDELEREAEYVYFRICLHIYLFDGHLKDDDQANARRCKMPTRTYRRAKAALLAMGKIEERGGFLANKKAEKVMAKTLEISEKMREKAEKRWVQNPEKPNKNNKSDDAGASAVSDAVGHATGHAADHANSGTRYSVPNGTDESEESKPGPSKAVDITKRVFDIGLETLGAYGIKPGKARPLVGKWRKSVGDKALLDILVTAGEAERDNIIEFVEGCIRKRKGGNGSAERFQPTDPEKQREARIAAYRKSGIWEGNWGPRPEDAETGGGQLTAGEKSARARALGEARAEARKPPEDPLAIPPGMRRDKENRASFMAKAGNRE